MFVKQCQTAEFALSSYGRQRATKRNIYSVLIDEKSTQSNQTAEKKLVTKMRTPAKLGRKKVIHFCRIRNKKKHNMFFFFSNRSAQICWDCVRSTMWIHSHSDGGTSFSYSARNTLVSHAWFNVLADVVLVIVESAHISRYEDPVDFVPATYRQPIHYTFLQTPVNWQQRRYWLTHWWMWYCSSRCLIYFCRTEWRYDAARFRWKYFENEFMDTTRTMDAEAGAKLFQALRISSGTVFICSCPPLLRTTYAQ